MTLNNRIKAISLLFYNYFIILISMAGFVPKHVSIPRIVTIGSSLVFSILLAYYYSDHQDIGVVYFIISEVFYIGFLFLVLSKNGFRHWFMKRWKNEDQGYLAFEAILGFLFYHNASSLGFIATSSPGDLFDFITRELLLIIVIILALTGFLIKIWAAKLVSIDIYYWKDMFLGKKISEFVASGPYKYFSNPMYGIGQLLQYAFAIWSGSLPGLIAAGINQILIFTFYFTVEKKFINRTYLSASA